MRHRATDGSDPRRRSGMWRGRYRPSSGVVAGPLSYPDLHEPDADHGACRSGAVRAADRRLVRRRHELPGRGRCDPQLATVDRVAPLVGGRRRCARHRGVDRATPVAGARDPARHCRVSPVGESDRARRWAVHDGGARPRRVARRRGHVGRRRVRDVRRDLPRAGQPRVDRQRRRPDRADRGGRRVRRGATRPPGVAAGTSGARRGRTGTPCRPGTSRGAGEDRSGDARRVGPQGVAHCAARGSVGGQRRCRARTGSGGGRR